MWPWLCSAHLHTAHLLWRVWECDMGCELARISLFRLCLHSYMDKHLKWSAMIVSMFFLHLCRVWELCASIRLSGPGHRALHREKEGSLETEKTKWWGCVYSNSACLAVIGNLEPCFWKTYMYMLLTVPLLSTRQIVCACACVHTHTQVTSFVLFFLIASGININWKL